MATYGPPEGLTHGEGEYPGPRGPGATRLRGVVRVLSPIRHLRPRAARHLRRRGAGLPRIAALGFDVVYLPPIHPIGHTHRKGKNNALVAGPDDLGSPWAIGNEDGGHTAVNPELGTLEDFRRFVAAARRFGMEIALDYALQCSPDHPWVREHPDWFFIRPDGTIKYAENPPKKYEDIYPINFWCDDREALWDACRDVFLFWIGHGVRIFRVDNPHTKPFAFWEWVIAEVHRRHPGRDLPLRGVHAAQADEGARASSASRSPTPTSRGTTARRAARLPQRARPPTPMAEYFRGNLFANTPDILHEYLQQGGRPAFRVRLAARGDAVAVYGIYSGFELSENAPVRKAARSTSTRRSTRSACATGARREISPRTSRGESAFAGASPRFSAWTNLSFHRRRPPRGALLSQGRLAARSPLRRDDDVSSVGDIPPGARGSGIRPGVEIRSLRCRSG